MSNIVKLSYKRCDENSQVFQTEKIVEENQNIVNNENDKKLTVEDLQKIVDEKREKTILDSYMMFNGDSKKVSELQIGDELMEKTRLHVKF